MSTRRAEQDAGERVTGATMPRLPTGTAEWADHTLNVARGCSYGCVYCYARAEKLRWGQIARGEDWTNEQIVQKRVDKGYRKRDGTIMFPSAHDITPGTVDACCVVLTKLLEAGNRVLVVTKADGPCCQEVRRAIEPWRNARTDAGATVTWRLTIGCLDDELRQVWEPHAPPIDMRLEVLRQLHRDGWETSVSAEPLLEPWGVVALLRALAPHVTETIWVGCGRQLRQRCAWLGGQRVRDIEHEIEAIEAWQTPRVIVQLASAVLAEGVRTGGGIYGRIRFKDSWAEALRTCGWQVEHGRLIARV